MKALLHAATCTTAIVALLSSGGLHAAEDARISKFEQSLVPAVRVAGTPAERWKLSERMSHWKVPGLSVAVIRDGKLAWAKGYGVLQVGKPDKVNAQTVFSVGSVSKLGAAAVTLRLAEAGKLDLDRDVNAYLRRWKLPENEFTAIRPATLRGILSHSAGLSVHGFGDFQPGAALPTVIDTLDGRSPATNAPVRVIYAPGTRLQYSGGGVTIEQLVIEEVTGLSFPDAARKHVLDPLGMKRSTYENPLPESHGNIAKAHGDNGEARALPRGYESMPETAASGLWTTPTDYAQLVIALIKSYQGAPDSFISARLAHQMMTEVGRSPFGLGPVLEGEGMDRRFLHGGSNNSYKAWAEGHLATGDGLIVFTNGANGSRLYAEVRRAVALAEGWSQQLSYHVEVPAIALSAGELQEKVGTYAVEPGSNTLGFRHRSAAPAYQILFRDGALYFNDFDDEPQRLIATAAARFVTENDGSVRVEFVRDYAGKVSGLILRLPSAAIEARKTT
jgi:CubicO group peptidase (beta-lactamase class C family)